jgi:hypothetical protein
MSRARLRNPENADMSVATPDWLSRHGGELRANPDGQSHAVYFGPEPEYVLRLFPVQGKCSCRVQQTINGKLLESGAAHPTPDDALRGGLEDLRKALGW